MLDFMRRQAQGWIVKVLFSLIVLSFVFWGMGDYFSGDTSVAVAKVGDQEITQQALESRVRNQRQRLRQQLGSRFSMDQIDPQRLRRAVLRQMIRERLLDLEAQRLNLTASDQSVRMAIQGQPVFQQGGEFSTSQYQSILGRMGMAPGEYENRVRQDLAVQDYRRFLQGGTLVAEEEVWKTFRRQNQERRIRYGSLAPSAFADQVSLNEQALRDSYEKNKEQYRRPARSKVRYVVLDPQAVAEQIEEPGTEELRTYYEENADRYTGDSGEPREFAEIRKQAASDWRRDRAVDLIYDRLPTFNDLLYTRDTLKAAAEEFGLEVRTSSWIPQEGAMPSGSPSAEAFREAAFQTDVGRNSEGVELGDGRFAGMHVLERQPSTVEPFEAVKEAVRQDLRRKRARELAKKKAEEARQAVAGGASLDKQLEDLGISVQGAGPVTREEAREQLPSGMAGPVFAAEEEAAGTAHVSRTDYAVFRVEEVIHPQRDQLTDQARQRIRSQIRQSRGQARLQAVLNHLRQRFEVRILKDFSSGQG
ncbi:peptidylprolyl isomerase [Thiohalorhabdus methylotrophus]|uniref:SurA N-terminal domain-containing protein n=1 Tax=Thiohalorhabdus methylotrophus TaxID=3242694 RepID=A0ABV4TTD5_9GAMM